MQHKVFTLEENRSALRGEIHANKVLQAQYHTISLWLMISWVVIGQADARNFLPALKCTMNNTSVVKSNQTWMLCLSTVGTPKGRPEPILQQLLELWRVADQALQNGCTTFDLMFVPLFPGCAHFLWVCMYELHQKTG